MLFESSVQAEKIYFSTSQLEFDSHGSIVRILVGPSWELYANELQSKALKQWRSTGRQRLS